MASRIPVLAAAVTAIAVGGFARWTLRQQGRHHTPPLLAVTPAELEAVPPTPGPTPSPPRSEPTPSPPDSDSTPVAPPPSPTPVRSLPREPRPGAPVAPLAIRWTRALALDDLAAVDEGLTRDLEFPGEATDEDGRSYVVKTCRDSLDLHARGISASGRMQDDYWARLCRPLELLHGARPARQSFVSDLERIRGKTLAILPAIMATAFSDEAVEAQQSAVRRGLSWRAYVPSVRVLHERALPSHAARIDDDGWGAFLELLAWADFDGDGFEDVLIRSVNYAPDGCASYERLFLLTRTTAHGVLRVLSAENGATGC